MDIRKGNYSYEEIFKMVESYEVIFREACERTTLPKEPNEKAAEELLISLYEDYNNNRG